MNLFKRQSIFKRIPYIQYKRPSTTRWVEHQYTALNSHINNLPIFTGFCNSQILNPHNPQIKKIVPKLQGYKNVCVTKRVVLEAIKLDVLRLEPVTKMLQETLFCHPNFYLFLEMELKFWKSFISWTEMGVMLFIVMIILKQKAKFWKNFLLAKKISYQSIEHKQQLQEIQTVTFVIFMNIFLKEI